MRRIFSAAFFHVGQLVLELFLEREHPEPRGPEERRVISPNSRKSRAHQCENREQAWLKCAAALLALADEVIE
jgi:hypothetical protein